tara:strand:- start:99 stop:488 length:390 start_codon:yes stop_codon:yes gene_type:complete
MAHFAELDSKNIVLRVIVLSNNDCLDSDKKESEDVGIEFCKKLYGDNTIWKQTSYNENMRKNYAAVGYIYDKDRDAFLTPQPFESWKLNETTCKYEPPIARPVVSGKQFAWDNDLYLSDNTKGWIEVTL